MDRVVNLMSAVDARSVQQRVYEEIRQGLAQGNFSMGQSLTIRGLAAILGTSEMPVREAIKRLVAERIIVQLSNRSFQVPHLNWSQFGEIMELRLAIEGMSIERATPLVKDEIIYELELKNEQMKHALHSHDEKGTLVSNQEFHFAIYSISKSSIMMEIIGALWLRSGPYLSEAISKVNGGFDIFWRSSKIHDRIIDSLRKKDAQAACAALQLDLVEVAAWYRDSESAHNGT